MSKSVVVLVSKVLEETDDNRLEIQKLKQGLNFNPGLEVIQL